MKKFLLTAALIVVVVSQLIVPPQAQAEEIFATSETRGGKTSNHYVITESIQSTDYGFKVRIHTKGQKARYLVARQLHYPSVGGA